MTEFYTIKRIDNSRLVRPAVPHLMRDTLRLVALGVVFAGAVMLYAWQHFECLQLGYQVEELQATHTQAAELNQQLHLEVASLRSPMRIDAIARNQLGLTVPQPGQVSLIEPPSSAAEVAQARTVALPLRQ